MNFHCPISSQLDDWKREFCELRFPTIEGSTDTDSAQKLKNAKLAQENEYLYKYLRYTKDTDFELLLSGNMRFKSPSEFNDAFEFQACSKDIQMQNKVYYRLVTECTSCSIPYDQNADYRTVFAHIIDSKKYPHLIPHASSRDALILTIDAYIPMMINAIPEYVKKQFEVDCYTTTYNNNLMWGHYADGHKGMCIEYEIPIDAKVLHNLYPVFYLNNVLDISDYIIEPIALPLAQMIRSNQLHAPHVRYNPGFCLLLALVKSSDWKYENEWRFVNLTPLGKVMYKLKVTKIFLGMNANNHTEKICNIARGKNIEVFKMEKIAGSFDTDPKLLIY